MVLSTKFQPHIVERDNTHYTFIAPASNFLELNERAKLQKNTMPNHNHAIDLVVEQNESKH